ncbi:hypothetical protein M427DRAFT_33398 [Gonapodya prolifera JEL478]|uniref:Uncharacterized protein n=1 Tax=Gonapodya prolifera (strain JEL478) TaxID=1344416 RepID=A0A139ABB5_GONPJ|nr:hypothetical protein M427DRAFT_33398 [Gonapodya prolifera JEL478]|eukprot:KXS13959.1 hypothetical protein M427DRAFT_33398 [Gonapodya prolifera JEL478]
MRTIRAAIAVFAAAIALTLVPTATAHNGIANWQTYNLGLHYCASSNAVCCVAKASVSENKFTCRPNADCDLCWNRHQVTCQVNGQTYCSAQFDTCCVAQADASSGKRTCRLCLIVNSTAASIDSTSNTGGPRRPRLRHLPVAVLPIGKHATLDQRGVRTQPLSAVSRMGMVTSTRADCGGSSPPPPPSNPPPPPPPSNGIPDWATCYPGSTWCSNSASQCCIVLHR